MLFGDSDSFEAVGRDPRSIAKDTGHLNGAVYREPRKVVAGRTYFDNLYLCGTDEGFKRLIGTMLSGISMANAYLLTGISPAKRTCQSDAPMRLTTRRSCSSFPLRRPCCLIPAEAEMTKPVTAGHMVLRRVTGMSDW